MGSLDLWLRNRTGALEVLDWDKRLNIATGAARGLAFLHHGFAPHIIHRDKSKGKSIFDTYSTGVASLERGFGSQQWSCVGMYFCSTQYLKRYMVPRQTVTQAERSPASLESGIGTSGLWSLCSPQSLGGWARSLPPPPHPVLPGNKLHTAFS
jgi:hypothetical protein